MCYIYTYLTYLNLYIYIYIYLKPLPSKKIGDISEEEGLWESLEIDGRMLAIWRDAVGLLQIRKLKVTVRKREDWRKKNNEETVPRKLYEAPQKKRKYTDIQTRCV
jgi:hypothetical protein